MPDIMSLLVCLSQCLDATTLRQLRCMSKAMLSMSGCVTMRGLSRCWKQHKCMCSTRSSASPAPPTPCDSNWSMKQSKAFQRKSSSYPFILLFIGKKGGTRLRITSRFKTPTAAALGGFASRRLEPTCSASLRMPPTQHPPCSLRSQEIAFASLTKYLPTGGARRPPNPQAGISSTMGRAGF